MTLSARAVALEGLVAPLAALAIATGGWIGVESATSSTPYAIPYVPTVPVTVRVPVASLTPPVLTGGARVAVAALSAISVLGPGVYVAPRRSIATVDREPIATIPPWALHVPTVDPGDQS